MFSFGPVSLPQGVVEWVSSPLPLSSPLFQCPPFGSKVAYGDLWHLSDHVGWTETQAKPFIFLPALLLEAGKDLPLSLSLSLGSGFQYDIPHCLRSCLLSLFCAFLLSSR